MYVLRLSGAWFPSDDQGTSATVATAPRRPGVKSSWRGSGEIYRTERGHAIDQEEGNTIDGDQDTYAWV